MTLAGVRSRLGREATVFDEPLQEDVGATGLELTAEREMVLLNH